MSDVAPLAVTPSEPGRLPTPRKRKLMAKQEQAALMVAMGALTDLQIAETLGKGQSTIRRWKRSPHFNNRVAELRESAEVEAHAILNAGVLDAVKKMMALVHHDDPWVSLRAASQVAGFKHKFQELKLTRDHMMSESEVAAELERLKREVVEAQDVTVVDVTPAADADDPPQEQGGGGGKGN